MLREAGGDVTMLARWARIVMAISCVKTCKARARKAHIRRLQNAPTGMAMITVDDGGENSIVVVPARTALSAARIFDQSREAIAQSYRDRQLNPGILCYAAQTPRRLEKTVI